MLLVDGEKSRADDTLATIVAKGRARAGLVCVDMAWVAAVTSGTEIGAAIAVEGDGAGGVGAALTGGTSSGVAVLASPAAVRSSVRPAVERELLRGVGRARVGEVDGLLAPAEESGTRTAVILFGMPEINAGGEPGSPPLACRSPVGALPLLDSLVFGTWNGPCLRVLTPGDRLAGDSALVGPLAVPAVDESGDDWALVPPALLSVGPSALAIPALPATAAPKAKANANAPTRPTYAAAETKRNLSGSCAIL